MQISSHRAYFTLIGYQLGNNEIQNNYYSPER